MSDRWLLQRRLIIRMFDDIHKLHPTLSAFKVLQLLAALLSEVK